MNKKGNVLDVLFIIGLLFFAMILVTIALYFSDVTNDAIQNSGLTDNAKTMTNNLQSDLPQALDFILIMIMIGLPIGSMILAYFNNIHPFFFYLSIALLIIIIMVGYAYQTLWENFIGTTLSDTASSMPMSNFILSHFSLYAIIVSVMILFGTYVKTQSGY